MTRRVTDDEARALCDDLAALQVLDSDRRSPAVGEAHGTTTRDPDAARVAQASSGALARARAVSERLRCVTPASDALTLRALVEVAHCRPTADALALRALREWPSPEHDAALAAAVAHARAAEKAHEAALARRRVVGSAGVLSPARQQAHDEETRAAAAKAAALAAEAAARDALLEEGHRVLRRALEAWRVAGVVARR